MADIHIRQVSDQLYRALKVRAAEQGITLKALLVPYLEQLVSSKPMDRPIVVDGDFVYGTKGKPAEQPYTRADEIADNDGRMWTGRKPVKKGERK